MSAPDKPTFGTPIPGAHYQKRPGCYALITRGYLLAVVRVRGGGYDLPGGGAELGESKGETLAREVREEIGHQIVVQAELGTGIAYVESKGEGYFEKICTFYHCHLVDGPPVASEEDHILEWVSVAQVMRETNPTIIHYWALTRLAERLNIPHGPS